VARDVQRYARATRVAEHSCRLADGRHHCAHVFEFALDVVIGAIGIAVPVPVPIHDIDRVGLRQQR
jgi:hypothetical protein